jgi:hypothetical protein
VFVTVGGGTRWERIDPRAPRPPANEDDELGPPDIQAWLDNPAAPPSVPMPLMRDPPPGNPPTSEVPDDALNDADGQEAGRHDPDPA